MHTSTQHVYHTRSKYIFIRLIVKGGHAEGYKSNQKIKDRLAGEIYHKYLQIYCITTSLFFVQLDGLTSDATFILYSGQDKLQKIFNNYSWQIKVINGLIGKWIFFWFCICNFFMNFFVTECRLRFYFIWFAGCLLSVGGLPVYVGGGGHGRKKNAKNVLIYCAGLHDK